MRGQTQKAASCRTSGLGKINGRAKEHYRYVNGYVFVNVNLIRSERTP